MQYQLQREYTSTHIQFANSEPLKDIKNINYFRIGSNYGDFVNKDFRISFDNINWEPYQDLTQINMASISFVPDTEFYIQVRYEKPVSGFYDITSFFIFFDLFDKQELPGNMEYQPVDVSESAYLKYDFPEYFLNRLNHTGPFSDLGIKTTEDPSVYDLFSHREDSSDGTTFVFKGLKPGDGISFQEDSSSIIISSDGGSGASYENPDPVVNTVGGIHAGDTFFDDGKTFADTMASMFYPTLYPNFSNPYNTFSFDVNNLEIIGNSIDIEFTSNFNRGFINPAYGTSGNRSGLPNTYHFTDTTGTVNNILTTSLVDYQFIPGYIVAQGTQTWLSRVSYDEGEQPLDSKGGSYDSSLPAGTTSNVSKSLEGVYPLFGTTIDINTYTQQPLQSMLYSNNIEFEMVTETGGMKQRFSVPVSWTSSRPLLGVETYNEFSGNWEYTGGSASASLDLWTTIPEQRDIFSIPIDYTNYIYNGVDRSTIKIRLKF